MPCVETPRRGVSIVNFVCIVGRNYCFAFAETQFRRTNLFLKQVHGKSGNLDI